MLLATLMIPVMNAGPVLSVGCVVRVAVEGRATFMIPEMNAVPVLSVRRVLRVAGEGRG
ncbi:MAG: hypothetical protein U0228_10710 [Myxococcaceae bacterium]